MNTVHFMKTNKSFLYTWHDTSMMEELNEADKIKNNQIGNKGFISTLKH